MNFGQKLKYYRDYRCLTIKKASKKIGISVVYLSEMERGSKPATVNKKIMEGVKDCYQLTTGEFSELCDIAHLQRGELPDYFVMGSDDYENVSKRLKELYYDL